MQLGPNITTAVHGCKSCQATAEAAAKEVCLSKQRPELGFVIVNAHRLAVALPKRSNRAVKLNELCSRLLDGLLRRQDLAS